MLSLCPLPLYMHKPCQYIKWLINNDSQVFDRPNCVIWHSWVRDNTQFLINQGVTLRYTTLLFRINTLHWIPDRTLYNDDGSTKMITIINMLKGGRPYCPCHKWYTPTVNYTDIGQDDRIISTTHAWIPILMIPDKGYRGGSRN